MTCATILSFVFYEAEVLPLWYVSVAHDDLDAICTGLLQTKSKFIVLPSPPLIWEFTCALSATCNN